MPGGGGGGVGFDLSDALRAFMRDFGGGGFDFEDLFGGAGGGRGQAGPRRGQDLRVRLKLTLEQIASGSKQRLSIKRKECACPLANAAYTSMLCHPGSLARVALHLLPGTPPAPAESGVAVAE